MDEARDVLSRVALLDPAPAVRARLATILKGAGAKDVVEDDARAEGWTLAFVDVDTAPGLSRFEAAMARDPAAPVVILTADPTAPATRRAVRLGAFGVLEKPIRREDALRLVDDARAESEPLVRLRVTT